MNRNVIAAWAAGLVLTLAATTSFAQQGMGQGRNGPPENAPFKLMDTNGNGTLSKSELNEWATGVFGAMDSDSNGKLTSEEYMTVRMGPGASAQGGNTARQEQMQAAKAKRFHVMDADGDGLLTEAEFMQGQNARFTAADRNGNGEISRTEWKRLAK
jgi:hypothetical protein